MTCYFFGTFNPIHLGHIEIAKQAKEAFNFKRIIFVPSFMPPHKIDDLASYIDRLNMVKMAVGNEDVSDIEFHLKVPSYTYRTIEKLYSENNNKRINFIIGYDQFFKIETWKNPEILKEKINFIIYPRHFFNGQTISNKAFDYFKNKGYVFKILKANYLDISSSAIRNYIFNNQDITGLTTKEVKEYIEEHRLYKNLVKKQSNI